MSYREEAAKKLDLLRTREDYNILAFESSCDETAVAVIRGREILSNEISSQIEIHKRFGGVVPEIASRNHVLAIDNLVNSALEKAGIALSDVDVIAVTYGAGLLGASRRPAVEKADAAVPTAAADVPAPADKPLRNKAPMQLSGAELCRVAKENADFSDLLHAAQQTAGWIFNESEIGIVASLYASLHLPGEFILNLIGYYVCKKEMPLRYVEKVAYDLCDKGITTPAALEEWLRRREESETHEGIVRRLFGLGQRTLTEKERAAVDSWFGLLGYGEDMVRAAYEKTVNTIGKASIAYASSILRAWHEAGYKTPADVEAAKGAKRAKPAAKSGKQPQSFDTEDFFEKAIRRSYGEAGGKS